MANTPTTQWTKLIEAIQNGGDEAALAALHRFCEVYRGPVVAYFERNDCPRDQAEELTQMFFEEKIIEKYHRRHGMVSPIFLPEDVKRLDKFIEKLRGEEPIARFLWGSLAESTRQACLAGPKKDKQKRELRIALASDLNSLMRGPNLCGQPAFAAFTHFSVETRNLLNRDVTGHWQVWLNRSVLVDACKPHLAGGLGFLYKANRDGGQLFRHFLWRMLKCFLFDEWPGSVRKFLSFNDELDSDELESGSAIATDYSRPIDRPFALWVIKKAAGDSTRSPYFLAVLKGNMSKTEAAAALGITENAFGVAFHRFATQTFPAEMRNIVSDYAGPDKTAIDDEIRYLLSLFT